MTIPVVWGTGLIALCRSGLALQALSLAGLLLYVSVALWPFRWDLPWLVSNGAIRDANGIRFPSAGLVRLGKAPDWMPRAIELGSLGVNLRVRSYSSRQFGPVRIFTISHGDHQRNLSILQNGADLVVRLRTPVNSLNGTPPYAIRGLLRDDAWHTVALVIRPGALRLIVDDNERLVQQLPARPLENWDRGYEVVLGNETTGRQPWLGEIAEARVEVAGQEIDYARPGAADIPDRYWSGTLRDLELLPSTGSAAFNWLLNLIGFVPIGILLGMVGGRRALWLPVALCATVAGLVEIAQSLSVTRVPSVTDYGLNVSGAALGGVLARRLAPPAESTAGIRRLLTSLLIAVSGIGVVGVGLEMRRARQHDKAVAAVRALGGRITPDHAAPVIGVDLYRTAITDAELRPLAAMQHLQWLVLEETPVTDAGLVHLKSLTRLESLGLSGTAITDAGLAHLKGLTNLGWLSVGNTNSSAGGIAKLREAFPRTIVVETGTAPLGPIKLQNPSER